MEDLFNILSSSARIDKSKRPKKRQRLAAEKNVVESGGDNNNDEEEEEEEAKLKSRDRTGKRDRSEEKLRQIHREQIAAFRRSMAIRLGNKQDPTTVPDPVSSFDSITTPEWWKKGDNNENDDDDDENGNRKKATSSSSAHNNNNSRSGNSSSFDGICRCVLKNIEYGKWKEPTPIQMQGIPTLLERRDFIGAAPTGSGKSGAFIIPALLLSSTPNHVFYYGYSSSLKTTTENNDNNKKESSKTKNKNKKKEKKRNKNNRQGEIRCLLLAPSGELAAQLHREVQRLGMGKPGGLSSLLLAKSNASNVISGVAGGKDGLDILVTTPLRLVDSIEKGLRLDAVRLVVLDEADRLLDAADGSIKRSSEAATKKKKKTTTGDDEDDDDGDAEEEDDETKRETTESSSGSNQTKTFLAQIDVVLSVIPDVAARALFSATVTPMVRTLSESFLRNPVDVTIAKAGRGAYGGANTDIDQELVFVGREDGKLLAMRQIHRRGQLKPPAMVFVESKERAQALFAELLYDGIHVDVIHAGRSKSARENAVAKFRRGDTWVLICTDLVARGVDFRAVNMVINYDLPSSGITYVHRIGRTGRAGRKGKAITLFTETDFDNLRTIANVMKQSGCVVEDWMLNLSKKNNNKHHKPSSSGGGGSGKKQKRSTINTTPSFDKKAKHQRQQMIQDSKKRKSAASKKADEN